MKRPYTPLLVLFLTILASPALHAQDTVSIDFTGMNPHVGQKLYFRVVDQSSLSEIGRTSVVVSAPDFSLHIGGILPDSSYHLDFYADHNGNGMYDAPPVDHAWRISVDSVKGDTTVSFAHNTDFTDILWKHQLTVHLSNMTPHLNQDLNLYLRNAFDGEVLDSLMISPIDTANFSVVFDTLLTEINYNLDFYADHNMNGMYDAPPADHAWRLELGFVQGDTIVEFVHNTAFTDIFEVVPDPTTYQLTLNFTGMTPHIGQDLILYLREPESGDFIDSIKVTPVTLADFSLEFDSVANDTDYNLDFYADMNENGFYDVPPVDHAWRIMLQDIDSDTTITFAHNTEFTDIGLEIITGNDDVVKELDFAAYPNPVKDELTVSLKRGGNELSIINAAGALVIKRSISASDRL